MCSRPAAICTTFTLRTTGTVARLQPLISHARFRTIDPDMFYYIPRLKVLAMGNNPGIRRVEANAFQYVPDVVRLELAECHIELVEEGAFQRMTNVQLIQLSGNNLQRVTPGIFANLPRLISLDLSHNNVTSIMDRAFQMLPALKHLDLSYNNVTAVEFNTFFRALERTNPVTSMALYLHSECAPSPQ